MVIEKMTTTYACSLCQRYYGRREDAIKCEARCAKLLKSPDISVLGLTSRTFNLLKHASIDTIEDALNVTDSDLLKLKGFGETCLKDLRDKMEVYVRQNHNPPSN